MKKKKSEKKLEFSAKQVLKIEIVLAAIIAVLLLGSLITEKYAGNSIASMLIIAFVLLKIFNIIRKGSSFFEEYAALAIIIVYLLIQYFLEIEINSLIIVVLILVILFSIGFMPKVKTFTNSNNVGAFIGSYIFLILIIIFLFAGLFDVNPSGFAENGSPVTLSFPNSLYFSTISFTTVGYGEIAPTGVNRAVAAIESLFAVIINIAFLGYVFGSRRFKQDHKK